SNCTVNITNSTLSGNTATGGNSTGGGIVARSSSTVNLTASTLTGNSATGSNGIGGGIFNSSSTVNAKNTIIANNTAATGPDVNGTLSSQGFNLIGNNAGATINSQMANDQVGGGMNPVINPLLASLGNYGGPTQTHALMPGSPAIDKGFKFTLMTDQ